MATRKERLQSIAETIKDYRAGEIDEPSPDHVDRWVRQFDEGVQREILKEMDHVLKHTYINKATVENFLNSLATNSKMTGEDPCSFWRGTNFLDIQGGGNSQREMLAKLYQCLRTQCGFELDNCRGATSRFIYIDDAIFTGNRILNDLRTWIQNTAPSNAEIHIVTMAFHRGGKYYAEKKITEAAREAGKAINLTWWRSLEVEDKKINVNKSDVLRPRALGNHIAVKEYAEALSFAPHLRTKDGVGEHEFFSSEHGRGVLEQEMLKAGANIRKMCPNLGPYQRPLGNMVLQTLGFGSTLVTYRNCPNNTPLAFWVGDPWYPLFPRKIN